MASPVESPDVKIADPDHEVMDVIAERWSPRAFADRAVEPEKLRSILEAARWTMSSYNEQPWRYVVARREDADAYAKVLGCLNEFNRTWAANAPVLMLGFVKTTFDRNGKPNRCAEHDLGAASASLTLQATDLGLYVHQMAGILQDEIRDRFDLPEDVEPVTGLAVGYLGDPDMLPEKMQDGERSSRSRKPLDAFVFGDSWGTAADVTADK